ncbi:N-acetylmuramoyl-L-alanine amidase [Endozoicomonas sp. OPT23]|uniref:N-acetylmuramoyl-L-alanine amidase family protein n=1 Tax=Endozoicomonas sp. OPT23 TaxID=2072845 RepID=UPI00129B18BE|nr:N-acetylmuramoyl-L-alanine amidase [Endozoicomonas sp. OPT23]MRI31655.1 N-acetylmuramoyl-L-alanine amidase [Endozoicomonas sp. OPT23]
MYRPTILTAGPNAKNTNRGIVRSLFFLLISGLILSPVQAFAEKINDIRLWRSPDKTRLVFDITGDVRHSQFFLDKPDRLVLDIHDTTKSSLVISPSLTNTPIKKVRYGVRNKKDLRIVLDLKEKLTSKSFLLKPNATYGYRLVVDLFDEEEEKQQAVIRPIAPPSANRDIVVAIDAGHGGEDPGAKAYGGGHEKAVTLKIAKELAALLRKEKGFKPVLVRTGDYYIPLRQRTKIARKAEADLFVSVHADAFRDFRANGASVFALSRGGATSETARWLAQKENSSDQIGGEGGISLSDKDDILAGVLLDLSMTSTLSSSLEVGDMVLKNIGGINRLHKKNVEQAGFAVLKSPDIPSILVETGFISNPKESRKLKSRNHQRSMARQIFKGVKSYFVKKPPPDSLIAKLKKQGKVNTRPDRYVIRAGDTLSEIASKFEISLTSLKRVNRIGRADRIRTGQVLVIPN